MYVWKDCTFYLTHIACRGALDFYMAFRGSQNTTNANIKSRIAPVGAFGYLGCVKNCGAIVTLSPTHYRQSSVVFFHVSREVATLF